jgi:hypothetical protein
MTGTAIALEARIYSVARGGIIGGSKTDTHLSPLASAIVGLVLFVGGALVGPGDHERDSGQAACGQGAGNASRSARHLLADVSSSYRGSPGAHRPFVGRLALMTLPSDRSPCSASHTVTA